MKKLKVLALVLLVGLIFAACTKSQDAEPVNLQSISFDTTELIMGIGDQHQLVINLNPENATKGRNVNVKSLNPDKASISKDLLITAKEAGTTIIQAESTFGGKSCQVKITVVPKIAEAIDFIVALRGSDELVYMTNNIQVTDADLNLVSNEILTLTKGKTIIGRDFTLDLSGISRADADKGAFYITSDDPVVLKNIKFKVPSSFASKESAIKDVNQVVTMTDCTFA